ncbi:MAG TPA: methyltransferase type 11 [Deltaproteobacteria bacterium]|nr:MAG: hypothetical protein A2Z79_08650 [Deltaproteobacteria bacterium GWA2_55_82]OGQ64524.1 MAG: hypothetical protein A3I81_07640 [Deltaproteobacteria bacterium RIFCSPLOWO2_02_FULL_55_12]OIJ73650.1 MAG: hypothetical protein A2V21_304845 [Deltaproteobacteria bacterium GWC2_55_46]HBG47791.1 methyltransferase type 11 [Deltaproteobacteria bacterium]HCY11987.1 methyltransferase type 11 [Deltaproteobacteria bacterium]
MEEQEYEKMYEMEDSYWWFRGKHEILLGLFKRLPASQGKKILDVGCGTGGLLSKLGRYGSPYGIDFSTTALSYCRKRGLPNLARGTAESLPFQDETFDVVTAIDVFYHRNVRDDQTVLRELARTLKKGGRVILSEPAWMFLYGPHDKSMHGKKRYNAADMRELMASCGLVIEKLSYFNFFLFPLILILRLLKKRSRVESESDVRKINPLLNRILFLFPRFEAGLLGLISFPVGGSVTCMARKP